MCLQISIKILQKKKILSRLDKLEKQNKVQENQLRTCQSELTRIREENIVLRDANIQFQVEIFKLKMQLQSRVPHATSSPIPKTVQKIIVEKVPEIVKVETIKKNAVSKVVMQDYSNTETHQDIDVESEGNDSQEHYVIEHEEETHQETSGADQELIETHDDSVEAPDTSYDATRMNQTDIQNRYKIKFGPLKLEQMNEIPKGQKDDSRFINLVLPWLFDREVSKVFKHD